MQISQWNHLPTVLSPKYWYDWKPLLLIVKLKITQKKAGVGAFLPKKGGKANKENLINITFKTYPAKQRIEVAFFIPLIVHSCLSKQIFLQNMYVQIQN